MTPTIAEHYVHGDKGRVRVQGLVVVLFFEMWGAWSVAHMEYAVFPLTEHTRQVGCSAMEKQIGESVTWGLKNSPAGSQSVNPNLECLKCPASPNEMTSRVAVERGDG